MADEQRIELRGRVLRCVIATGAKGCSLDETGVRQTWEALESLDDSVGAVLLVGEGASFCTGGDVRAFGAAEDPGAFVRETADAFHRFVRAVVRARVPVVAGVQGWAAGAGMSIVCATDVAIAGESTRLRPGYPGIGFSADGGMTWTLPRLAGAARARRILLTDQVLDAQDALDAGIVSAVVPDDELAGEADQVAARLAAGPTAALGRIKRLVAEGAERDLESHLEAEAEAIAASAAGPEGREGLAAFAERRPARFHS